ncbi:hypothetical protein C5167_047312 [Papaver somniferum]|uniref:Uncharacterized protein n=1 Tax=Papaver somniferum TaxID=3469 RepID=A0A4Y7LIT2_PAPSO|nr:hypothetical protein C5167_047312 [Papaver somniferum]
MEERYDELQVANANERIEIGSGVGVTMNLSQIIERNSHSSEYSDSNMEAPISFSLTTGPAKLSGDSLNGGLHLIPSIKTIYPDQKVIGGFSVPSRHALVCSEI